MTLTPSWAAVIITLVALVCGALAAWLRLIDKAQEREIKAVADNVAKIETRCDVRMQGLHDSENLVISGMEVRLREIENTCVRRTEHAEFRAEMLNAVRDVGRSIDSLRDDIKSLIGRVASVEGRRP